MEKSTEIKNIAKALQVFQLKMEKVGKDSSNPFFKSKYASLSNILEHIQMPLQECNLAFSQHPDNASLTTILIHTESGEYLQSSYLMPIVKANDPQAVGSSITYARRYALGAILGLNIDEDDDGNKASDKAPAQSAPELPWLNKDSAAYIAAIKKLSSNDTTIEKIQQHYKLSKEVKELLTKSMPA